MSLSLLLIAFALALTFVMASIVKFKMHPFLSLMLGALLMGLIVGMPLPEIAASIAKGFGGTMTGIGIVIVLGVILGQLLYESGATEEIAETMLRATGEKNAVAAVNLTGLIVSIPVFFDAAFVILVNLVKQLSRKGKIPYISLVSALACGLIIGHCMIIPTPGPLAVAGAIGVNIGWMVLYAIFVSLIASLVAGVLYAKALGRRPEFRDDFAENAATETSGTQAPASGARPSGGLGVFLIFLPIFIILTGTVGVTAFELEGSTLKFFKFIGDKNIALLIGVLVAYACLRKYLTRSFESIITSCAEQAGVIFIITGAGGALAAVINATGIGGALADAMRGWTSANAGAALIVIGYVISQILRATTGSATVALITTAGILAPIVANMPISPVLVALAICSGGVGLSLPNDSGFWVVNRFSGFTLNQTFLCWTLPGTIAGLTSVACLLVLNMFSGVLPGLM